MSPDDLANFLHGEASFLAAKYGDQDSTPRQRQLIASILKENLPGDRGDGGDHKGVKDDLYRKFLAAVFHGANGSSDLMKREASALISWMFWEGFTDFDKVTATQPYIMAGLSVREMHGAVREILRRMGDSSYLDFQSTGSSGK